LAHKPLSPAAVAALGCLRERPMHPYEMFQTTMNRQADRVVKLTPGSLYRTVYALEADGLVAALGVDRDGGRPEKTTYQITDAGNAALIERLREMLEEPTNEYPAFGQALAEAHTLASVDTVERLRNRSAALREGLRDADATEARLLEREVPERFWINLDYTRTVVRAELDWIEATINRLETSELEWPEAYEGPKKYAIEHPGWNE